MISVVIPTLNESQTIRACLAFLQKEIDHHEIIVVDGGSRDDTPAIVGNFPDVKRLRSSAGRGLQMNRGAEAAQGDILLFLHADTCLPAGGLKKVEAHMKHDGTVAGTFALSFDHPDPILRLYARFSRINHILFTYGDQGLFVSRHVFVNIGGFREIPIMEDVEIQERLRKMGRFVKIRQPVTTSARRYLFYGVIKQQMMNTALVLLYHSGVPPSRLKRFYPN